MSIFKKIGKAFTSAVDTITPDVTVGSPTKPVENLVQGATNLQSEITGSVIGGLGDIANQTVTAAGGVLSNPAAGSVLGAAGAYFGVPGLGQLANQFQGIGQPQQTPNLVYNPSSSGLNKNVLVYGGIGAAVLLILTIVLMRKKGK